MSRKKLIAGNWKMFKTTAEAMAFAEEFLQKIDKTEHEVAICAPFTQLSSLKDAFAGTAVKTGAQNMHFEEEGAYTGEISPLMLSEIGVDYVVIGHSERRQYFNETDESVNLKIKKAFEHDITPIFCLGERLEQREAEIQFDIVRTQLNAGLFGVARNHVNKLVIAYEPVWAIGTGRNASPEQAEEMCAFIRDEISRLYDKETAGSVRIQYGGSVKPANASELLSRANIDGALVGGASLKPQDFIDIIHAK